MIGVARIGLILLAFAIQNESGQCRTRPENDRGKGGIMVKEELKQMPKLDVQLAVKEKSIQIDYKVTNTTGSPIYLFNVIWEYENSGKVKLSSPNAYVSLRNNSTLLVAKQVAPLPKTKAVELRVVPLATKLEAGKDFAESVVLPIPVEEFNPYFIKQESSRTEPAVAESLVFAIQFIREIDGLDVRPGDLANSLFVRHSDLFGNLELLEGFPKSVELKVEKRMDAFERF